MRVPLRWLCELIGRDVTSQAAAEQFTLKGLSCEGITRIGSALEGAVVAEVVAAERGAVMIYDGRDVREVAISEVAPLMPDTKIAWRPAERCLVREAEVGFADSPAIVSLTEDSEVGSPVLDWIDSEILELEIPPNRGDLAGMIGIARELAAYLEYNFEPRPLVLSAARAAVEPGLGLDVTDRRDTPDYIARFVFDVRVMPSPFWLKWRLAACGVRSINNVVDVTNLMLFKYGQPLHAFDLAKLSGSKILTRRARSGEKITTIDGLERELSGNVLVIADALRPVAIAGIMGGQDTEITDSTHRVLIECARFAPAVIRRGVRELGLATEASRRFEMGVDAGAMSVVAEEAAALVQSLAQGQALADMVEVRTPVEKRTIEMSWSQPGALLGREVSREQTTQILTHLGFRIKEDGARALVEVPSFRSDVETPADLIEEVGRVLGYEGIPSLSCFAAHEPGRFSSRSRHLQSVREIMIALGFDEVQTVSFVSQAWAQALRVSEPVLLCKPLTERYAVLRPSLLPGLVEVLALNVNQGCSDVRVFEMGMVYPDGAGSEGKCMLGVAATGAREPLFWGSSRELIGFHDLTGVIELVCTELGVGSVRFEPRAIAGLDKEISASVCTGDVQLGGVGKLDSCVLSQAGLSQAAFAFELDFAKLLAERRPWSLRELGRFPAVTRDFAFVADQRVPAQQLLSIARDVLGELLDTAEVFDCFSGSPLPEGKRSLGIRVTLRSAQGTLDASQLEALSTKFVQAVAAATRATLRGQTEQ